MPKPQPTIYQLNTAVFLFELSAQYERQVTLGDVPDEVWDEIARRPVDMVWFMGVWKRSPRGREMSKGAEWLKKHLPDMTDKDVIGSAYSIEDYVVDDEWGGNEGLAAARQKLKDRGIGIMLDYVPNHVGIDHPWVDEHPEYFLKGDEKDLEKHPGHYVRTESGIFANGRDPQFDPWIDVLQLNAFNPGLRQASIDMLNRIASMADGVRCDMAMLLLNDEFEHTWGKRAGERPIDEFWPAVIARVKQDHPDFLFLAEVYWKKEARLLQEGFDFCYDKELYDDLIDGSVHRLHRHLKHTAAIQPGLLRFIENHDEERAASAMYPPHHQAAAIIMATLPGARLFHQGQFEGRMIRIPVQLRRGPFEERREEARHFYDSLLSALERIDFKHATWQELHAQSRLFHIHSPSLLAWSWTTEHAIVLVMVNFSRHETSVKLALPRPWWQYSRTVLMGDPELQKVISGSLVTFKPWAYSVLILER